jgi:hypothetical protein
MSHGRSDHWNNLKQEGFTPLCSDWNADGSGEVCEVFIDSGFGSAVCISCRQAYRKDAQGNIEYYR